MIKESRSRPPEGHSLILEPGWLASTDVPAAQTVESRLKRPTVPDSDAACGSSWHAYNPVKQWRSRNRNPNDRAKVFFGNNANDTDNHVSSKRGERSDSGWQVFEVLALCRPSTREAHHPRPHARHVVAGRRRSLTSTLAVQAGLLLCLLLVGTAVLWGSPLRRYPAAGDPQHAEDAVLPDLARDDLFSLPRRGASSTWWVTASEPCGIEKQGTWLSRSFWTRLSRGCADDQLEAVDGSSTSKPPQWDDASMEARNSGLTSKAGRHMRVRLLWWSKLKVLARKDWRAVRLACDLLARGCLDLLSDNLFKWHLRSLVWGTPRPSQLTNVSHVMGGQYAWTLGDREGFCSIIGPGSGTSNIAIVGNGPLSAEQRKAIEASDLVVRFNAMNNRLPGERTDVWFVRYMDRPPMYFWGLTQLGSRLSSEVVDSARAVVFLGGPLSSLPSLYRNPVTLACLRQPYLKTQDKKLFQVNITGYWHLYTQVLSWKTDLRGESRRHAFLWSPRNAGSVGLRGHHTSKSARVRLQLVQGQLCTASHGCRGDSGSPPP
eukprot:jgi/Botrbrau1/18602/Bobra.0367s0042.1